MEEELELLKQIENIRKINILIITDFIKLSNFYRLARTVPDKFLLMNSSRPLTLIQKNDLPVYFVLNRNLFVEKSFIPNQSNHEETIRYLNIIIDYLLNDK